MSQEKLLQYIHFNRHYNTLLVRHNTKLIEDLRTENAQLIQKKIDQLRLPKSIEDNTKLIEQLRINLKSLLPGKWFVEDKISKFVLFINLILQLPWLFQFLLYQPGVVPMLVRKQCENPVDFFNKDFRDYQDGFAANGKL